MSKNQDSCPQRTGSCGLVLSTQCFKFQYRVPAGLDILSVGSVGLTPELQPFKSLPGSPGVTSSGPWRFWKPHSVRTLRFCNLEEKTGNLQIPSWNGVTHVQQGLTKLLDRKLVPQCPQHSIPPCTRPLEWVGSFCRWGFPARDGGRVMGLGLWFEF